MSEDKLEIVDIIDHRNAYGIQTTIVLNRYPQCVFERAGRWLVGYDDCVFQFYGYGAPSPNWEAFGGWQFKIPMADGSEILAKGQWWDEVHPDFSDLTYDYGMSTIERLQQCYVFTGGFHIDRTVVDEWRATHESSNNYHKYNLRSKKFGEQWIVSQW